MSATYNPSHYQAISKVETKHFWFRARGHMLRTLINRFIPEKQRGSFLEVGCGTGIVLSQLQTLGFDVTGLDVNEAAITYAKKRCPDAKLIRQSIFSFTSPERFRAIGAFDVLEHQARDTEFLKRCYGLLEDNGMLFLTVPAGMWLWNRIDVLSGHKRRYEMDDLRDKLMRAGFTVQFCNYWNCSLTLPWYILYRAYTMRQRPASPMEAYLQMPHAFVNRVLLFLLQLEQIVFFRVRFTRGATLVICAKK